MKRAVKQYFTPEIATELLKYGKPGNLTSSRKVERYKTMMMAGKWKDGRGTSIIFKNGVLIDGCHRLTAISETGLSYHIPFENV